jgi:hypothetical protein
MCSAEEQTPPDQTLLQILQKYYKEKGIRSIVDFGPGQCTLLSTLKQDYEVLGVNPTTTSPASFMLRSAVGRPIYLGRKFDIAQSLYVQNPGGRAEFADTLFATLANHATKGIVLRYHWGAAIQLEYFGFKYNKEVTESIRKQFNNSFKSSI